MVQDDICRLLGDRLATSSDPAAFAFDGPGFNLRRQGETELDRRKRIMRHWVWSFNLDVITVDDVMSMLSSALNISESSLKEDSDEILEVLCQLVVELQAGSSTETREVALE